MSKRKLNNQQKRRIQHIQNSRAQRAEQRRQQTLKAIESGELGPEEPGLVIAHYGKQLDVEALQGDEAGAVVRCHLRANLEGLVTGDRVVWCRGQDAMGVVGGAGRSAHPNCCGPTFPAR